MWKEYGGREERGKDMIVYVTYDKPLCLILNKHRIHKHVWPNVSSELGNNWHGYNEIFKEESNGNNKYNVCMYVVWYHL